MASPCGVCKDVNEDDSFSSISGATLEKACRELGENPATRGQVVKEFRERILTKQTEINELLQEADQVTFGRTDRKFLLRFLRARKFDMDKALHLYVNYYKYRKKFSLLLDNFHPQHVRNILDAGLFGMLPKCMNDGTFVFSVIPSRWDYHEPDDNGPYKAFLLVLEKLLENEEVQVHGLAVFDNLEHSSVYMGYAFIRAEAVQSGALLELQDAFPLRFKGLYMLNQPWYISIVMKIVRPFLKQKNRDRIQALGNNFSILRKLMDPSHIPVNFGGDAPEIGPENLYNFFEHELSDGISPEGLS